jgi:3-hydroxymyristoyl/3-hydroxydecanoyl-(acyl carrier protein) dehydratase
MQATGSFRVSGDHPCLPGHFLGGAIVPGVVLLDEAFALMLAAHPDRRVIGLPSAKFVRPVLPAQTVVVTWREAAEGRIAFTCAVAAQVVLHGSVRLESALPGSAHVGSTLADPTLPGLDG